ncbi:MAG: IPT/TIG domain-containing protein, partial [Acidimicrobiales bacterium]
VTLGGPLGGGTQVDVTGSGFVGATRVSVGSVYLERRGSGSGCRLSETGFCVRSDNAISFLSPPAKRAGPVPVAVITPSGASQSGVAITPSQEFDYLRPPRVATVTPSGPPAGGYSVTVEGAGFAAYCGFANAEPALDLCVDGPYGSALVSQVDVGTGAHRTQIPADEVNVLSYSELTFTMPAESGSSGPGSSGPGSSGLGSSAGNGQAAKVSVVVQTVAGSGSGTFSYSSSPRPAPTISSVGPNVGTTYGETPVQLTGTGFSPGMTVAFGGIASNDILSVNAKGTVATVLSPAGGPGQVPVDVITPWGSTERGDSFAGPNQFTYTSTTLPVPTVLDVSSDVGPSRGGTEVTITGSGFFSGGASSAVSAIDFGGAQARKLSCRLDTTCLATLPSHRAGEVAVTVTVRTGSDAVTSVASGGYDRFTYTSGPGVTDVAPPQGPAAGGTKVAITGFDLTGARRVSFGSVGAASFSCTSATSCTAVSAAGSPGPVHVVVTTRAGASPETASSQFTYLAPTVAGVTPDQGPTAGGTRVLITGSGLSGASAVHFGKRSALSFHCVGNTTCTAVSPPDPGAPTDMMGQVDVTVTVKGATSIDTPSDTFTYVTVP